MRPPTNPPGNGAGKLLYSVEEAAGLLGVGRTFMFYLIAAGEIESVKIGKLRKIPHDALIGYITRLRGERASLQPGQTDTRGT